MSALPLSQAVRERGALRSGNPTPDGCVGDEGEAFTLSCPGLAC